MTVPPPLSTSTPIRSEEFQTDSVVSTCSTDTRHHSEVQSLTSHRSSAANSQHTRLTDGQVVQRTISTAVTRAGLQYHQVFVDDKIRNCDDLRSTQRTPGLRSGPRQPSDYSTMPTTTRRSSLCGPEPASYQLPALGEAPTAGPTPARRSSPSVFRFDAPHPLTCQRLDSFANGGVGAEPSPIYAEPCDRLTDGRRHRVAVRRCRRPPTTDTVAVVTPPISAGYR